MKSAALLALSLVACSSSRATYIPPKPGPDVGTLTETYPVYIDKKFTADEHASIHAALDDWNLALNGYLSYTVGSDEFDMEIDVLRKVVYTGQGVLILRNKFADYKNDPDFDIGTLAFVYRLGSPVVHVIQDAIGTRNLKAIVMHEIGHTLGIPHVVIKGSLMFPGYPYGTDCVDRATVQTLSALRPRFDWRRMRYCERPL